jgi:hypothetical protein
MTTEIRDWIVQRALAGESEMDILTGVCEQLEALGFRVVRASLATDLLDPTYDGRGVRWNRGQGGIEEVFPRADGAIVNETWVRSPFYALSAGGLTRLRLCRSAGGGDRDERRSRPQVHRRWHPGDLPRRRLDAGLRARSMRPPSRSVASARCAARWSNRSSCRRRLPMPPGRRASVS